MEDADVLRLANVSRSHAAPASRDAVAIEDFATFYERSRVGVYRVVLLRARAPDVAEDACHEAYERAFSRWDRLQSHPNPTAWVVQVALNQATSWWRRRRRELAIPPEPSGAPDGAPFDEALVRLVWQLPYRQRQVIGLRILLDLSVNETARVMRTSPGTVKATLHHALRSLRKRIHESESGVTAR
jgi:RNA polymerase sigma-70 factor (ECF subfamily)